MAFFGPTAPTTSMIGSDILDIGSRKALAKRQRGMKAELGIPGQFDVPNVDNVRSMIGVVGLFELLLVAMWIQT